MSLGDAVYVGVAPGSLILQEANFRATEVGFDTGRAEFILVPGGLPSIPARGSSFGGIYPKMFVSDVDDSLVEQGNLSKVVVEYKGLLATKNGYGETDTEAQMLSLIGSNSNTDGDGAGASATYLIPVPKPIFTWTYVVTTDPGQGGVGLPSGATFLPSPASWDITVAQGQSLTYNYYTGWVLESRRKKTVYGAPVYEVVEKYAYYYPIG